MFFNLEFKCIGTIYRRIAYYGFQMLERRIGAEREIRTPVENSPPVFKTGAVGRT